MRMRNRLLGTLTLALLLLGMVATTGIADPGPNGNNDKGLCTAYFNGQKKGHDKQRDDNGAYPGPFAGLEEEARAYTDEDNADNDNDTTIDEPEENEGLTVAENIFNYCDDTSEILGNPAHGRFTCSDDPATGGNDECSENDEPGNGGGNGRGSNG